MCATIFFLNTTINLIKTLKLYIDRDPNFIRVKNHRFPSQYNSN